MPNVVQGGHEQSTEGTSEASALRGKYIGYFEDLFRVPNAVYRP